MLLSGGGRLLIYYRVIREALCNRMTVGFLGEKSFQAGDTAEIRTCLVFDSISIISQEPEGSSILLLHMRSYHISNKGQSQKTTPGLLTSKSMPYSSKIPFDLLILPQRLALLKDWQSIKLPGINWCCCDFFNLLQPQAHY